MNKKHYFHSFKLCASIAIAACTLLTLSCADHYDGDEEWSPQKQNSTLLSPDAEGIKVVSSPDGSSMTISWPVVYGAGGYIAALYNVNDPNNPILVQSDSIDGCSFKATREEDTNYMFTIRTLGNQKYSNKEAQEETIYNFNTFLPTFKEIPNGTDLTTWFAEAGNLPEDSTSHLCYDLEPGGTYTISGNIDFGGHQVTLRSSSKSIYAKLSIGSGAIMQTWGGFTLKYLDIDCSQTNKPLVELSSTPDDSIKNLVGTANYYFIQDPIVFQGCNVSSLNGALIADVTGGKYVVRTLMLNNCIVEIINTSLTTISLKAGSYVTDFTVKNSTIYCNEKNTAAFLQYNGRPKELNDDSEKQCISFLNSTLYQLAYNSNFRGDTRTQGQKSNYFTVERCIIVDCGKDNFCQSLLRQASTNPTVSYSKNTYWKDGVDKSANQTGDGCDQTGTALTTDPSFVNPATGDFTPTGSQQVEEKTGDPRWFNQ